MSIPPDSISTGGSGFYLKQQYDNATKAELFVYNSDFSHNRAIFGAGMSIVWKASSAGEVVVNNCTFYNNTKNFSFALIVAVSLLAKIHNQINVIQSLLLLMIHVLFVTINLLRSIHVIQV